MILVTEMVSNSALRRIAMCDLMDDENRLYRNKIKWLIDYNYQNPGEGTAYKDFDSKGLAKDPPYYQSWPNTFRQGTRAWFPKECHEKLNLHKNSDENERRWLIARRYIYFLHGTMRPDVQKSYSCSDIPAEDSRPCQSSWLMVGPRAHHVWWEEHPTIEACALKDASTSAEGAYYAREAAADAESYLNYDSGDYKARDGSTHRVKGKFEMAAIALGGMTHYIADLSSPPHTLFSSGSKLWNWESHTIWDEFADRQLDTKFMHTTPSTSWGNIFPNGGPNWEKINPSQADIGLSKYLPGFSNPALEPIDPYAAAMMMSLITFSACDISGGYMGEFSAGARKANGNKVDGLKWDVPDQFRAKTLLKWAVYYTACAIMWVLDRCEIVNEDTTTGRLDILSSRNGQHIAPRQTIATNEVMKEYSMTRSSNRYAQHLTDSFVGATVASFSPQLLFASFSILGTVSLLVGIPIADIIKEKIKERELEVPLRDSKPD